ncbi:MAG: nucleotidyl transferase AbiEii/AbiGii toxin family protein [Patescibacteria group bacterium]
MHAEALIPKAAALFPKLAKFKNFYLVGGTALALQIGHRISVDFDMFSADPLSARLLPQIKKVFNGLAIKITYGAPDQINLLIDGIKYTFFWYNYPLISKLERYQGVPLASVREIAAMKAFAIGKRLAYKDYVDWYFLLLDKHVRLTDAINTAKKKFGHDFNDRLFLGQLASMDDIPTQKINFLGKDVGRLTIEQLIKKQILALKMLK